MAEDDDFLSRWSRRKRAVSSSSERVTEIIDLSTPLLPASDISNARELVVQNEYGVALELICTQLDEYEKQIDPKLYKKIKSACSEMSLPNSYWKPLDPDRPRTEVMEVDETVLLERLGLPSPETLKEGDDFSGFMQAGVPEFLRKRALRVLWRSNPVLANLDGLNDYDDDFNSPELTQKVLATGYQVGRGFVKKVLETTPEDDELPPDEAPLAEAPQVEQAYEIESEIAPDDDQETLDIAEENEAPRPRRMRFVT